MKNVQLSLYRDTKKDIVILIIMSGLIAPKQLFQQFFASVSSTGANIYRIGFGIIMIWEAWRFLYFDKVLSHWLEPTILFKYPLFGWVHPLPGQWMYIHIIVLGILGVLIALGLFYRVAIILMFLGFSYIFLLEATRYLNHFYLICLLSFIMIFLPLNRGWSMDALLFNKSLRPPVIPKWALWLLRFQIGVPYFFGGIAKINKDWLRGEPMHMWLIERADYPIFGSFADTWWLAYIFSYGGLFLDLLAVPFLLWKPTRALTFLVLVLFHMTNAWVFSIGVFPWMMLVATTVFLRADWPVRLFKDIRRPPMIWFYGLSAIIFAIMGGYCSGAWRFVPIVVSAFTGLVCLWLFRDQFKPKVDEVESLSQETQGKDLKLQSKWTVLTIILFSIWVLVQSLVPLRHWIHPTWVHWTEQGHYFSWRMKLRDKAGDVSFWVTDKSGQSVELHVSEIGLSDYQSVRIFSKPDLVHQAAYYIQDKFASEGYGDVQVYARNMVSLNDREEANLVDPYVDLTEVPRRVGKFPPVIELDEPFR